MVVSVASFGFLAMPGSDTCRGPVELSRGARARQLQPQTELRRVQPSLARGGRQSSITHLGERVASDGAGAVLEVGGVAANVLWRGAVAQPSRWPCAWARPRSVRGTAQAWCQGTLRPPMSSWRPVVEP